MNQQHTDSASAGEMRSGTVDVRPTTTRENVWMFAKDAREQLSADFFTREFTCRCRSSRCHFTLIHPKLVDVLQTLRHLMARPIMITSGFRCKTYNKVVGGRPRSYHLRGMAADLLCHQPEHLDELVRAATDIPDIGGIGTYPLRRFVHVDVRHREPFTSPITWSA